MTEDEMVERHHQFNGNGFGWTLRVSDTTILLIQEKSKRDKVHGVQITEITSKATRLVREAAMI